MSLFLSIQMRGTTVNRDYRHDNVYSEQLHQNSCTIFYFWFFFIFTKKV